MGDLEWLNTWYASHCDGDWEHGSRISITTLDNPGWRIRANLEDTEVEEMSFPKQVIERDEHDWVHVWVENKYFEAAGGPENLCELLAIFRSRVESMIS